MKYYCDTNFILRYLLADDEKSFIKTKDIFSKVQKGNISVIIEQTVFTEAIFVLSSFYKVPKNKISETLCEFLSYKKIICEDKKSLLLALEIYKKENLHIVDCILIAKSSINNVEVISFDKKLIKTTVITNNKN
jgi:predicted nucleic-acid-binding protein